MSNETAVTKTPIAPTIQTAENGKEGLPHPVLVSAKELAAMLGCSEAHLWRLHSSGRLPAPVKLGRLTRWPLVEIEDWIAHKCPPRAKWDATRQGWKATR
ncbi:MAG: helix-turn-helix domain-containing protein, partial [Planctomycetes bacterium]|nr:helix-turn-helix domain-containing protein [Planctomycetota bacterium]